MKYVYIALLTLNLLVSSATLLTAWEIYLTHQSVSTLVLKRLASIFYSKPIWDGRMGGLDDPK